MPANDNDLNHGQSDDDSGSKGTGQQGGAIKFREFVHSAPPLRDDLLPPDERKRLLAAHKFAHEISVKKGKERAQTYADLKNGQANLQEFRQAKMAGSSQFKANPVLANQAQFSGTDKQVNPLITEYDGVTNDQKRHELDLSYRPQPKNEPAPKFNPTPFKNQP